MATNYEKRKLAEQLKWQGIMSDIWAQYMTDMLILTLGDCDAVRELATATNEDYEISGQGIRDFVCKVISNHDDYMPALMHNEKAIYYRDKLDEQLKRILECSETEFCCFADRFPMLKELYLTKHKK